VKKIHTQQRRKRRLSTITLIPKAAPAAPKTL